MSTADCNMFHVKVSGNEQTGSSTVQNACINGKHDKASKLEDWVHVLIILLTALSLVHHAESCTATRRFIYHD